MPFIEVTTREPLSAATKTELAENLSNTMLNIEIGGATDAALQRDWIWFKILPQQDWAIGGRFDGKHESGRTFCLARIIAPEGFLNTELKLRAIREVTRDLRRALAVDTSDTGTGIWVHVVEIPDGQWGSAGAPEPLLALIDAMEGNVSSQRRTEIQQRFEGKAHIRRTFEIPS